MSEVRFWETALVREVYKQEVYCHLLGSIPLGMWRKQDCASGRTWTVNTEDFLTPEAPPELWNWDGPPVTPRWGLGPELGMDEVREGAGIWGDQGWCDVDEFNPNPNPLTFMGTGNPNPPTPCDAWRSPHLNLALPLLLLCPPSPPNPAFISPAPAPSLPSLSCPGRRVEE